LPALPLLLLLHHWLLQEPRPLHYAADVHDA
jgi:hypothetical protein